MLTQNVDRKTFEVNSERVLTSSIAFAFLLHDSFALCSNINTTMPTWTNLSFDWFDHGLIKPEDRRVGPQKSMEPERRPFCGSTYFAVMSGVKIQSIQHGSAGSFTRMMEREVDLLTNTFAADSKKHRVEAPVICKISPEVILIKKGHLNIFTYHPTRVTCSGDLPYYWIQEGFWVLAG